MVVIFTIPISNVYWISALYSLLKTWKCCKGTKNVKCRYIIFVGHRKVSISCSYVNFLQALWSSIEHEGIVIQSRQILQTANHSYLFQHFGMMENVQNSLTTVYPKKYAHGFCFAVLCCGYTLTDFPISIKPTSLSLWQSNDCPSASKATLMNMDKYFMWIHYERLHKHNKAKHNKTVCIFLGIYCMAK